MFGTIRRHQKWLWIVISTVTIISFVAFFSPQRRRQAGWSGPRDYVGSINGRPVTRDQYANAYRESELRYLFNYGEWPGNEALRGQSGLIEREVRSRLLLMEKLNEMNVRVSEAATAQWIIDAFRDRTDKTFRKDTYDQFIKTALPSHGLSESDFERFASHEVGIQHLAALAGTAGKLVTPQEAETLFRRENEQAEAEAVFISSSNYVAKVVVDPAGVETYYTNQQALYRIPEKLVVSYVQFAASNYLAEVDQNFAKTSNLTQIVEATYQQRGTNAFKDANNVPLPPAEAKEKVREEVRQNAAMILARQKAVEFANELFELKDKTDGLEKLAAAKGLVSAVTDPFAQFETPKNMKVPPAFGQAAAKLTPEEPVAEQTIDAEDAVYIIALKRKVPSEIPPLDSIRERVSQDYINSKALELARASGRDLQTALTNGLAAGKTFQSITGENNASAVVLAPFTRKDSTVAGVPNRADTSQVVNMAFTLSPGQVSSFIPTRTGGFLVYLKAIVPVADAKSKADLPEFTKKLRQTRQYEAFNEWFQKQMEVAHINLPGDKQRASVN